MGEELKPCPFCREKDCIVVLKEKTVQGIPILHVVCGICAASGPQKRTKESAIEAWNRRG